MKIQPIDEYCDLFFVEEFFPTYLVEKILATDWQNLSWTREKYQEDWNRKKIVDTDLPWKQEWINYFVSQIGTIENCIGKKLLGYQGTSWWLDEPTFICPIHTDGELPGAMQINWIGSSIDLGTSFFHYKNSKYLRYKFPFRPNTGYLMINSANKNSYRHLQWHGMLHPVPNNTFRLTSYSWLTERK